MPDSRQQAVLAGHFASFGELLKYLRRRAGLTQRELSIAVGYSESQISRLEQNQRLPDGALLQARFLPALHVDAEPEWTARLLELGGVARAGAEPKPQAQPPATPRHNLPMQLTSFIGREKELAEIKALIIGSGAPAAARLVTLTGHGGCGKTRLALQAAAALLPRFANGVWLVELAPLADPEMLPRAMAAALGLDDEPDRSTLAVVTDYLRGQEALLVLDNCEHLVQASANIAEGLLQACPGVAILATSREMLGVAGEQPFYVPSLSTPAPRSAVPLEGLLGYEAVCLFVERAAVVAPDFALTTRNAAAVTQICQRLDGIPLAIELAAARLRMLPVDQIAARLDNAFRLLTGGSRTALPRHQTLQALIDWSYDLLTHSEATLLRRLAVFTGGWTLEAAEAICSDEAVAQADLFELLSHLVEKSLVLVKHSEQGRLARYRLLETIHQYALTKLAASGEADTVRQRHAAYYFDLAEAGAPNTPAAPTQMKWLYQLEAEHDNLRAALAWSLETMGADAGVSLVDAGDIGASAWALNRLGWAARERGDSATARARLEQSLEVYRQLDDRRGIAWTAVTLGEVLVMQNEFGAARASLEEGLALSRELGESAATGWALNHLGHLAQADGDLERANQLQQASLESFRDYGPNDGGVAWALHSLGEIALARGDAALARRYLLEALQLFERIGERRPRVAWCLAGLAGAAALDDDPRRAAWLWGAAEAMRAAAKAREAPMAQATHERLRSGARARLGAAEFDLAWAEGQAASAEQILAFFNIEPRVGAHPKI